MIGGVSADVDEFADGEVRESFYSDVLLGEIAADESGICLAYFDECLACLMVWNARDVEAAVFISASKYGDVEHMLDRITG